VVVLRSRELEMPAGKSSMEAMQREMGTTLEAAKESCLSRHS
jgi:hypothetical protein